MRIVRRLARCVWAVIYMRACGCAGVRAYRLGDTKFMRACKICSVWLVLYLRACGCVGIWAYGRLGGLARCVRADR
ncbi:hypothetical protein BC936DRAFT_143653 [Jimgerdemannia flammicorona]|uniref:Uncharacterized protein n=1 Tax=Jimgerdemannia flammicorona TaxID=994334 RepID=A0A432ZYQ7_9FUNG|nr:hypothetical protein BC936DRAFT_143653 [Jimgerdemannia flammicorona]